MKLATFTCLGIFAFLVNSVLSLWPKILTYEYGQRNYGDILSYVYVGVVPAYQPQYELLIKSPLADFLPVEINYNYVRVQYSTPFSKVNISYIKSSKTLEFHIKYPFTPIPYGVDAYTSFLANSRNGTEIVNMLKDKF